MTSAIAPQVVAFEPRHLMSWEAFWDASESLLKFPDYFGRNKDAWDECFCDLVELEQSRGGQVVLEVPGSIEAGVPSDIYEFIRKVISDRELRLEIVVEGSVG